MKKRIQSFQCSHNISNIEILNIPLFSSRQSNYESKMTSEVQTLRRELSSTKKLLDETTTSLDTIQKEFLVKKSEGTNFERQILTLQTEVEVEMEFCCLNYCFVCMKISQLYDH